jgi:hypothetical protein
MLLSLRREVEVPTEILYGILNNLSQRSLKRVRLVCTELAAIARPLLFKSISISPLTRDIDRFLNIIRDTELSRAVEELIYREMHFETRLNPWMSNIGGREEENPYAAMIQNHYQNETEDETATKIRRDRIREILGQLHQEYEDQATAMKSGHDLTALEEGLRVMCNLKRIITKDARPSGITTDTGFVPPSLGLLRAHFPASDASLRLGTFSDPSQPPDHGFFAVLRALAATEVNVPMLVTERTTGLLKQGILLEKFSKEERFHQAYTQGFRQLRMISLCVEDDSNVFTFPRRLEETALSACILAATNLEHMELSVTHQAVLVAMSLPLRCFLPFIGFRKLHTLVLEGIHAMAKEITLFLVLQAGFLRHLTLWNIRLLEDGRWEHVLAALFACEAFRLESFVLKSPEDDDVRQHQEVGEAPARILDEDVLHFVNEGGINPFAKRDWRSEPSIDIDTDAGSNVSDVSDFSMWKEEQTDDMEDIDHDPDGPEHNSDYDTEPDIDFDGSSDDSDLSDVDLAEVPEV